LEAGRAKLTKNPSLTSREGGFKLRKELKDGRVKNHNPEQSSI
jgi:hypothetical protein